MQLPWLKASVSQDHDLPGVRENFSPRAKWRNAIDAVRATNRLKALGAARHLQTSLEHSSTEDSGGWNSLMSSSTGLVIKDGRTTSDEEDHKDEGVGEEWEPKSRHSTSTSTSSVARKDKQGEVHHVPSQDKVAGKSIHEGHAHAIPSPAGDIETKPQQVAPAKDKEDSDSDDPWIPGAFIWDKIMHHHHKKR
jgi:hypothetical protein